MLKKKVLITGASEGIGRELACQLAIEGYQITAIARNSIRLQDLTRGLGTEHNYRVADLGKVEDIDRIADLISEENFDLLINNAGFGVYGEFSKMEVIRFREMLRLNCEAVMVLTHAFLKHGKAGDALINISSNLAFLPMPAAGVYAATKAFVTSFSESLWYEEKKRGIYVMNFCPGATSTHFHSRAGGKTEETPPNSITQHPTEVVRNMLVALKNRKKPTVVSGFKNLLMSASTRLIPRKLTVGMMGKIRH